MKSSLFENLLCSMCFLLFSEAQFARSTHEAPGGHRCSAAGTEPRPAGSRGPAERHLHAGCLGQGFGDRPVWYQS